MARKRTLLPLIAVFSTLLFVLLQVYDPAIVRERLEGRTYDLRLLLRNAVRPAPRGEEIVIVAVDEKSIGELGRWPWSRTLQAELISRISTGRPRAIGIDIMYSEPESGEGDHRLAEVLRSAGNVVLATAFLVPEGRKPGPVRDAPDFLWDGAFMEVRNSEGIAWKALAVSAEKVIPPLADFASAASLGHVSSHPDLDGVSRSKALSLAYGEDWFPHFSLQVARTARGIPPKEMVLYGGAGIRLGDQFIRTDIHGRVYVNYRGKERSFPYLSASDVITGRTSSEAFRGRIVLVGTSALATYDEKVTPFSANMPGVEENANIVENVLQNSSIRPSPGIVEIACIVLTGILLGFAVPLLRALPSALLAAFCMTSYIVLCCYLLFYQNIWANLIYPVANMLAIFSVQTITRFFHEEKRAKEIRRIFSCYVSPKIVHELMEDPDRAGLSGVRREVTVLFSDIIGFTSLSERKEPEAVVGLLNEYFGEMVDIILRWDGTLDKFSGDLIMALWSAPVEQPDHAERALCCALEMSHRLAEMQASWKARGSEVLGAGIGINTGEVLIGNIGAPGRKMDYTAIGDHVNLTARVEKLTREYGVPILVTEYTVRKVESASSDGKGFSFKEVASVRVKGREKEIKLFGVGKGDERLA